MKKKKSPWVNNGGSRPGSGRKPTGHAKSTISFCCDAEVADWYRGIEGSKSELLEKMIRRSKSFKDWKKWKK